MIRVLIFACVLLMVGCATKVERVDSDEQIDLSGAWNDTDSQLVAEEMISDVLSRPWIDKHLANEGSEPTVIVGSISNLSHEHINTRTFVRDMERELINSGRVEFVASAADREEIRSEREDQDLNSTESTRNAAGQEIGADYMLKGSIETIIDANAKKQVRYYQVNLSLISMADNRIVWRGQKEIKKKVSNAKLRY